MKSSLTFFLKAVCLEKKKKLQCFLVRNKEPIDVTLASEIKIYPYICKPIFFLYFFHIPGKNAVLIVFLAYQLGHLPIPTQLTSSPLSYDSYKPGYFHKDMCITGQSAPLRGKHYLSSYTSSWLMTGWFHYDWLRPDFLQPIIMQEVGFIMGNIYLKKTNILFHSY